MGEIGIKSHEKEKCIINRKLGRRENEILDAKLGLGGGGKTRNHRLIWLCLITAALLCAPAASFRIRSPHYINQGEHIRKP